MEGTGRDPGSCLTPSGQADDAPPPLASIRLGTRDDIDAVFALNWASFPEAWSHESLSQVLSQGYELRVWNTADGRLCAYTLTRDTLDEVHILQLAVAPPFQRQGLARRLTQYLLEEKQRTGLRLAYLEVRLSNKPAQALYKALGFIVAGSRRHYYTPLPGSHEREDALLMTRTL
ncbi:MAG TPA: ribosomal protein S18-alanine N-acetyltransferase [Mariprofundaceae bacterium]|nr:ribosomal protein S18-alanine N-acetyltransferase [Mariprofundaceae bacterium]